MEWDEFSFCAFYVNIFFACEFVKWETMPSELPISSLLRHFDWMWKDAGQQTATACCQNEIQ